MRARHVLARHFGLALSAASLLSALLTAPACAQSSRARTSRARAEARLELEAAQAQADVATALYVTAAVILGAGLVAILAGSILSFDCMTGCMPAEISIGAGAAGAGVGLVTFIVATALEGGANDRRRRALREALGLAPRLERGGVGLALVGSF
ncbi:MAG: hypothetical protein KF729_00710 [Sandaracinaceae bacterium]|nr:hypothetical protein [Sandaracinaceae bacterium]